jgi:cell division protease FtsH
MSEKLGFVRYSSVDSREMFIAEKEYSQETAATIDAEVRRLVDEAYSEASRMLDENWDKVTAVAESLIKYETLSGDEVHKLIRGETLNKPTISDLLRSEAARRSPVAPAANTDPEPPTTAVPTPA